MSNKIQFCILTNPFFQLSNSNFCSSENSTLLPCHAAPRLNKRLTAEFGQWWGMSVTTRTMQHSFCCQQLLLLLAQQGSSSSSRVGVRQMTMPRVAKVVQCKMAKLTAKVARWKTMPHIPIAVRPKPTYTTYCRGGTAYTNAA
jgi:hypothetical protein